MASDRVGLKTLGGCLAAAAAIELVVWWAVSTGRINLMTALGCGRCAEILVFIMIVYRWGGGLERIGLSAALLPGVIQGLIWAGAVGVAASLILATLAVSGMDPLSLIFVGLPREPGARIAFLIVGGLIGPVAEEIFFRGIVYGYLRRWGIFPAMVLSTAAFVLLHSAGGILQIAGGMLFASAYEATGRLTVPMTIHVAGNTALFALSMFLPLIFPFYAQP